MYPARRGGWLPRMRLAGLWQQPAAGSLSLAQGPVGGAVDVDVFILGCSFRMHRERGRGRSEGGRCAHAHGVGPQCLHL